MSYVCNDQSKYGRKEKRKEFTRDWKNKKLPARKTEPTSLRPQTLLHAHLKPIGAGGGCADTRAKKKKKKNICFYFSFCLLSNDLPVHPTTTFLVARFPTPPVAVATTATTPGGRW